MCATHDISVHSFNVFAKHVRRPFSHNKLLPGAQQLLQQAEDGEEDDEDEDEKEEKKVKGVPRCSKWRSAGPSLAAILDRFCDEKPRHCWSVDLFLSMLQSYGREDCDCEYQTEVPFAELHDASIIPSNAESFLSWFMVRKVMSSRAEKKAAATAMSVLLRYCASKNYLPKQVVNQVAKDVRAIGSFDGDDLGERIQQLYDIGYWDGLRDLKGHASSDDDDDDDDDSVQDDGGMVIKEVRSDGWVMAGSMSGYMSGGYTSGDESAGLFLHLPPQIASKGKPGVRFSCMSLVLRRNVWSPQGMYGEVDMVYANVYPP
jgi:hypothetical protein